MTRISLALAAAAVLISGGLASAQQQQPQPPPMPQAVTPDKPATPTQPAGQPAGPILPDKNQPAKTEQNPPVKSPNAPLADD
jgi:hypothetical protein